MCANLIWEWNPKHFNHANHREQCSISLRKIKLRPWPWYTGTVCSPSILEWFKAVFLNRGVTECVIKDTTTATKCNSKCCSDAILILKDVHESC